MRLSMVFKIFEGNRVVKVIYLENFQISLFGLLGLQQEKFCYILLFKLIIMFRIFDDYEFLMLYLLFFVGLSIYIIVSLFFDFFVVFVGVFVFCGMVIGVFGFVFWFLQVEIVSFGVIVLSKGCREIFLELCRVVVFISNCVYRND